MYGGGGMPGRQAGSVVGKYSTMHRAKTGQQKVQLYYEDDPLCLSTVVILFIYGSKSLKEKLSLKTGDIF